MITRDINQLMVVPALTHNARFNAFTVGGQTCYISGATSAIGSSEFFPGYVIDRLGLPKAFKAVMVAPVVYGDYGSSADVDLLIGTLSVGIMHASASGGTFAAYSTADWLEKQGFWRQSTATSTANKSFAQIQRDVGFTCNIGIGGLTSTTTATADGQDMTAGTSSTGPFYYAGPGPTFGLEGAKRYIRVVMRAQVEADGCAAAPFHMSAAAIFGEPDEAQPGLPNKRILVTSGCAT